VRFELTAERIDYNIFISLGKFRVSLTQLNELVTGQLIESYTLQKLLARLLKRVFLAFAYVGLHKVKNFALVLAAKVITTHQRLELVCG
jgi:hypothetical protein